MDVGNLLFQVENFSDNEAEMRSKGRIVGTLIDDFDTEYPDCLVKKANVDIGREYVIINLQVYFTDMDDLTQMKNTFDAMIIAKGLQIDPVPQQEMFNGEAKRARRWWQIWRHA
jgi:hypothetical protein